MNSNIAYGILIEKNRGKDKLLSVLNKIARNCDTSIKELNMRRIIKYILEPIIGESNTKNILEKFNRIGGDEVMTAIDYLIRDIEEEKQQARIIGQAEGEAEGRLKGIVEGKEIGMRKGIKEGLKEGRKEGIKEGREEGRKKTAIMIAKELIKMGLDIERVCKITRLEKSEIEEFYQ